MVARVRETGRTACPGDEVVGQNAGKLDAQMRMQPDLGDLSEAQGACRPSPRQRLHVFRSGLGSDGLR